MRLTQEIETTAETAVRRPSLMELAEEVASRQPLRWDAATRGAIEDASLAEYRAALVLGRLHVCGNCDAFQFRDDPAGLGRCSRFDSESWAFVPFQCGGFAIGATPAVPAYLPDPAGALARAREYGK